jgi:hypothetical protein
MLHTVCWAQDVFRSEGPAALAALIVEKAAFGQVDGDVMVDFTIWLMIGYDKSHIIVNNMIWVCLKVGYDTPIYGS